MLRRTSILLSVALLLTAFAVAPSTSSPAPAGTTAADPGLQEGVVDALCPRPPDDDCYTLPIPGQVWSVASRIPIRSDEGHAEQAIETYDALIPEPYVPIEGEREVAVLMFRMNIPADPQADGDTDPGEGYAEGTVAIRVGFPAAEGYPYREGWFVLAQPLNDASQYQAGRDIGLPKYMAESSVRRQDDGSWTAHALDWGVDPDAASPGIEEVEDGNVLEMAWSPQDPEVTEERADQLWLWGQYGEALFVQNSPYDTEGDKTPGLVKFTPVSYVPVTGLPASTPLTEYPDPQVGTMQLRLEGSIAGIDLSTLVAPGVHTVAGTVGHADGAALMTVDDLSDNGA